jgi:2-polyprenyl-3-methyl-5-hydroxy-6-metoxy-1,4-benzoquinol methylase
MAVSKYDTEIDLTQTGTSHAIIVELVGSNKRVLDIGCSTGYLARTLRDLGNTVSGVEYDEAAAAEARPHLADLEVGDLEGLDLVDRFGEGQFEVVVFGDVLEHLRDPLPVLRQARYLLVPGGSVVISVPNIAHGDVRLALLAGRFQYTKLGLLDETHTRFFTRENLDEFLRDAGFVAVDMRRTHAPLFTTEIGVRAEDFDAAVIAAVQRDPESETYQFVFRAVRDDAGAVAAEVSARAERLELRVRELDHTLAEARRALAVTAAERDAAAEAAARSAADAQCARAEAERLGGELAAVYRTKVMRATRLPRGAYSAMRSLRRRG